jgi:hypothetical protein
MGFDYLRENAIQIARELQSLKNARDYDAETNITTIDQRRKLAVSTLDVVFRKRFLAIQKNAGQASPRETTINMNVNGTTASRKANFRTLDSRQGVSKQPMERPSVVEVFHIGRDDPSNGSERGSMKSTTSF